VVGVSQVKEGREGMKKDTKFQGQIPKEEQGAGVEGVVEERLAPRFPVKLKVRKRGGKKGTLIWLVRQEGIRGSAKGSNKRELYSGRGVKRG